MSLKLSAWVAAFMLAGVVLVALGGITIHAGKPTPAPTPHPTPTQTPNALDTATGVTAHSALIAWPVAVAILPFFALIAIALHPPPNDREPMNDPYSVGDRRVI